MGFRIRVFRIGSIISNLTKIKSNLLKKRMNIVPKGKKRSKSLQIFKDING